MIEFLNLNNTEPYDYFRKLYLNALEKDQRFIQAVCISSYNKNTNIVSSRYVNLKYIEVMNGIFTQTMNHLKHMISRHIIKSQQIFFGTALILKLEL